MEIKNIILLVIFISGLVFMQLIQAQNVDEIIEKYAEARGGRIELNSIKSLYMEGIREMMGNEVIIKITKVQDKLLRKDFEFKGTSGYTIVTKSAGWSFIPMQNPRPVLLSSERLKALQAHLDIAGPLIDYADKGSKTEFIGKEDLKGGPAYKIKITLNTGKEIIYFIDAKSNLLIQSNQMTAAMYPDGYVDEKLQRELVTNFSNYRYVDGILFPFKVSNSINGRDGESITFTKIELNKTFDKSQFEPYV
jgi:hypothetical protein